MKIVRALLNVFWNALSFAIAGAVICAVAGLFSGIAVWLVIGLPVLFAGATQYVSGLTASGAGGLMLGFSGGGVAFAIAGLIQSVAAEFDWKNPFGVDMRFEACLNAAVLGGAFCAFGGALTGAASFVLLSVWYWGGGGFAGWHAAYLLGAGWGGGAGYVLGLFIGAIAPGAVFKAHARWREWRRGARTL
jgi:hypothetical protein